MPEKKKVSMTLNEKLTYMQVHLKAKKSRRNKFGNYDYRSAEDILEAIKPIEEKLGVSVIVSEEILSEDPGMPIINSTATISDGENNIRATAIVGVDVLMKGMAMPQRFGAASSYAKKYALGNLFLIDDTADADATNSHGKEEQSKLKMTNEVLEKSIAYIKGGGDIDSVLNKYETTATQLKKLREVK